MSHLDDEITSIPTITAPVVANGPWCTPTPTPTHYACVAPSPSLVSTGTARSRAAPPSVVSTGIASSHA
jgi:hypothetical protein